MVHGNVHHFFDTGFGWKKGFIRNRVRQVVQNGVKCAD